MELRVSLAVFHHSQYVNDRIAQCHHSILHLDCKFYSLMFAWAVVKQFVVSHLHRNRNQIFKCFLCGDDQSNHGNLLHFWMAWERKREDLMSFESRKWLWTNIDINWIYVHLINSSFQSVWMHWEAFVYGTMVDDGQQNEKYFSLISKKIP